MELNQVLKNDIYWVIYRCPAREGQGLAAVGGKCVNSGECRRPRLILLLYGFDGASCEVAGWLFNLAPVSEPRTTEALNAPLEPPPRCLNKQGRKSACGLVFLLPVIFTSLALPGAELESNGGGQGRGAHDT